jgi:hypothetical protein
MSYHAQLVCFNEGKQRRPCTLVCYLSVPTFHRVITLGGKESTLHNGPGGLGPHSYDLISPERPNTSANKVTWGVVLQHMSFRRHNTAHSNLCGRETTSEFQSGLR